MERNMSMAYTQKVSVQEKQPPVKTILVVEDDDDLAELIMEVIQQEGPRDKTPYKPVLATDSMQALEISRTIKPNLFLLDYYLPRMNGLELYDRLHAMEGLEEIPAIFMSANPPRQEIEKRNLISVKKPFNLKDLLLTIEKALA
jgi:CheY-like chemotaxis protein